MADEFSNPLDRANAEALRRELLKFQQQIRADVAAVKAEGKKGDTREQRAEKRLAREEGVRRRTRATTRAAGEEAPPEERVSAEERQLRARRARGQLEVVESRASKDRLSATERIAQAERDIGRARAQQALSLAQQNIQAKGVASSIGRGVQLPGRRGTISAAELAARQANIGPGSPGHERRVAQLWGAAGADTASIDRARYERWRASQGSPVGGGLREELGSRQRGASAVAAANERAAIAGVDQQLSRDIQMHSQAANTMRRHGALTTEFFEGLARGEVTLAEVRYQVGATIAKFAGWTAASVAVFGVLDAVRLLAKGAIDAGTGVNQISRYVNGLNTEEAQQKLIDYSKSFNLPIDEVATATARMGQVFHTQAGAFTAAKAALYAVQIGELDAADATKYLVAIQQGAKLPADQLLTTFDKINAVQNQYGVSIRDTVAGTAKAAGAWHAAGGNLDTLIGLITVAKRATGRTGENIGTALQRSAEGIYRRPLNQQQLRSFGIDPNQNIEKIYGKAFRLVQSGQVKGRDITKLGTALSTPQYAPILSAVLQNRELFNKVQKTLGGDVAGIREREFKKFLASPEQQLKRVGIQVQDIGAELLRMGAIDPFGLMLKSLNQALSVTTDLLDLYNTLPEPLQKAGVYGLYGLGVTKLAGRFGIGSGQGPLGFLGTGARQGLQSRSAQAAEVSFLEGQREQAALAKAQASYRQSAIAAGAVQGDLAAAEEATIAAERELQFATTKLAAARGEQAVVAGATTAETAAAGAAGAAGVGAAARRRPVTTALLGGTEAGLLGAGSVRQLGSRARSIGTRLGASAAGLLLDPLVLAFGAYLGAEAIKNRINKQNAAVDFYGAGPQSGKDINKILQTPPRSKTREYAKSIASGGPFPWLGALFGDDPKVKAAEKAQEIELHIAERQAAATRAGRPAPERFADQIVRDAKFQMDRFKKGQQTRAQAQKELDRIAREIPLSRSGEKDRAKAKAALDDLRSQLGPGRGLSLKEMVEKANPKEFTARVKADAEAVKSYLQAGVEATKAIPGRRVKLPREGRFGGIGGHTYVQEAQQYKRIPGTPAKDPLGDTLKRLRQDYVGALQLARKDPSAENLKKLADARTAIDQVVATFAAQLDEDLKLALTPSERARAFAKAGSLISKLPHGRIRKLAERDLQQKRYQDFTEQLDALTDLRQARETDPIADARIQITTTGQEISRAIKVFGRSSKEVRALISKQYANYRALAEAQVGLVESQGAIAVAQQTTDSGKARAQLGADERVLATMRSSGRYGQAEINQQLAKVIEDRQAVIKQVAEDAKDLADSLIELRESRTTDPIAIAKLELEKAKGDLKYAQTPAERNRALAEINKSRREVANVKAQEAADSEQFKFDIGKVTREQYIAWLDRFLKTHKSLRRTDRDLWRQLKRQLYDLKKQTESETELDLAVGDIRLPTVYDVRRLAKQGTRTAPSGVVHQNNEINVHPAPGMDEEAIGAAVYRAVSGNGRSAARAAGIR